MTGSGETTQFRLVASLQAEGHIILTRHPPQPELRQIVFSRPDLQLSLVSRYWPCRANRSALFADCSLPSTRTHRQLPTTKSHGKKDNSHRNLPNSTCHLGPVSLRVYRNPFFDV